MTFSNLEGNHFWKIDSFCHSVNNQKHVFVKAAINFDNSIEVSFQITSLIAKIGWPFIDDDFAKKWIMTVAEKICLEAAS